MTSNEIFEASGTLSPERLDTLPICTGTDNGSLDTGTLFHIFTVNTSSARGTVSYDADVFVLSDIHIIENHSGVDTEVLLEVEGVHQ
jgi:hypothetical protein